MNLVILSEMIITTTVALIFNSWLLFMMLVLLKRLLRTVYYRSRKARINPRAKRIEQWFETYFLDYPIQVYVYMGTTFGKFLIAGSIGILDWLNIDAEFIKGRATVQY